jgi:hypothetical protein
LSKAAVTFTTPEVRSTRGPRSKSFTLKSKYVLMMFVYVIMFANGE